MAVAFVTGGTGFIGRHLLDVLTEQGWSVTAMARKTADTHDWPEAVTVVEADLLNPPSVVNAVPNRCDAVFHVAADTSPWRGHRKRQYDVNVGGTKTIIHAAQDACAKRLVHVSTVAVWGHHPGIVDETVPQKGENSWVGYVHTKAKAERRVKEAVARGLDAVICNPGHVLGKYDTGNWSQLFALIRDGALPGLPPGAGSFANGRKVAEALVAAAEKGRTGENYLLGGPYMSFVDLAQEIATLLDQEIKAKAMPSVVLKTAARGYNFISRFTGKPPKITPEGAYFVCHDEQISSAKAEKELGYELVPVPVSLKQSFDWLSETGRL